MTALPVELNKLHDIHLPTPISSWTLAPGWYVLMALIIGLSATFFYLLLKRRSQQQLKRHVLKTLTALEIAQQQNPNSQRTAAAISALLRQVALTCYPREHVAGLQGKAWLAFLDETQQGTSNKKAHTHIDFISFEKALLNYPYQPPLPAKQAQAQLDPLLQAAKIWLNQQQLVLPKTKRNLFKRGHDD